MDRYWRINRTLLQKLEHTQYIVSDEEKASVASLEAFEATYDSAESMERSFQPQPNTIASLRNPTGVFIAFAEKLEDKKSITMDVIRRIIVALVDSGATALYLVKDEDIHAKAAELLEDIKGEYRVTTFRQEELMFNVTRHQRVPRHELLTPPEAARWLADAKLKRSQMPRIFEEDPQVKWLDGVSGDIVRVTGPSPTVGTFVRHLVIVRRLGK